jgi:Arc/MetJ-type ribon-helix-helix transcriptional regulator
MSSVTINFRLSRWTKEQLERIAEDLAYATLSDLMREIVTEWLDDYKEDEESRPRQSD